MHMNFLCLRVLVLLIAVSNPASMPSIGVSPKAPYGCPPSSSPDRLLPVLSYLLFRVTCVWWFFSSYFLGSSDVTTCSACVYFFINYIPNKFFAFVGYRVGESWKITDLFFSASSSRPVIQSRKGLGFSDTYENFQTNEFCSLLFANLWNFILLSIYMRLICNIMLYNVIGLIALFIQFLN